MYPLERKLLTITDWKSLRHSSWLERSMCFLFLRLWQFPSLYVVKHVSFSAFINCAGTLSMSFPCYSYDFFFIFMTGVGNVNVNIFLLSCLACFAAIAAFAPARTLTAVKLHKLGLVLPFPICCTLFYLNYSSAQLTFRVVILIQFWNWSGKEEIVCQQVTKNSLCDHTWQRTDCVTKRDVGQLVWVRHAEGQLVWPHVTAANVRTCVRVRPDNSVIT